MGPAAVGESTGHRPRHVPGDRWGVRAPVREVPCRRDRSLGSGPWMARTGTPSRSSSRTGTASTSTPSTETRSWSSAAGTTGRHWWSPLPRRWPWPPRTPAAARRPGWCCSRRGTPTASSSTRTTTGGKSHDLAVNPEAALLFYWEPLGRQVRIEGSATRTTGAESDAYFATRDVASQVGAYASHQSRPIGEPAGARHRRGAVDRPVRRSCRPPPGVVGRVAGRASGLRVLAAGSPPPPRPGPLRARGSGLEDRAPAALTGRRAAA